MPKGCFAILLPTDVEHKVLGYYLKSETSDFKVTNDLFLRLNLDHGRNEYNLLKLKELILFSYIHKLKGKINRKASGIIIGLILNENEKPEKFRSPLKESAEQIENLALLDITQIEFENNLKEIYHQVLEPLVDLMHPEVLKEGVIEIAKFMLSGGKKERKIAQILLKKIEDNEHEKISDYYKAAENALKSNDYDKAAKNFKKAAEIAEELYVIDIAESLKEKANFSVKTPELSKRREKLVQEARTFLRNEDFHSAYITYKKAAELSKQLVEFDKEEEYRLKSEALKSFHEVDQKYSKK